MHVFSFYCFADCKESFSRHASLSDRMLGLCIYTYHSPSRKLLALMANGEKYMDFWLDFGESQPGEWHHLVYTFDGKNVPIYRDGVLIGARRQGYKPRMEGVPLWIGRFDGIGKAYFHAIIDEVRVYNRAISRDEILAHYKREATVRGKDTSAFRKPLLSARAYPGPGKIVASLDARRMFPLPEGSKLLVALYRSGSDRRIQRQEIADPSERGMLESILDVGRLLPGRFLIRASAVDPDGSRIGEESSITVECGRKPEEFKNMKVLNNLVWELLDLRGAVPAQCNFTLLMDRWVFIRSTASVRKGEHVPLSIDSEDAADAAMVHKKAGQSTLEVMRFLKAGRHTIYVGREGNATLEHLVVRAIPVIHWAFAEPEGGPHIQPYGPYDWEFLSNVCAAEY